MLWHLSNIYLVSPFVLLSALSLNQLLLPMHTNGVCSLHTLLCRQTMVCVRVCVCVCVRERERERESTDLVASQAGVPCQGGRKRM